MTGIGWVLWPGGRRALRLGAAALAAVGVLGAVPQGTASASAQDLNWTKQAPAVHPSARIAHGMAYDAATGTVVLFGGFDGKLAHGGLVDGTWTWDGTTWTQQAPAVSPPARAEAAMAYDAATSTAVLFGGFHYYSRGRMHDLNDTWTWG